MTRCIVPSSLYVCCVVCSRSLQCRVQILCACLRRRAWPIIHDARSTAVTTHRLLISVGARSGSMVRPPLPGEGFVGRSPRAPIAREWRIMIRRNGRVIMLLCGRRWRLNFIIDGRSHTGFRIVAFALCGDYKLRFDFDSTAIRRPLDCLSKVTNSDVNKTKFLRPRPRPPEVNKNTWRL